MRNEAVSRGAPWGLVAAVLLGAGCGPVAEGELPGPEAVVAQAEQWHGGGQTRWVRRGTNEPERDTFVGGSATDRDLAHIVVGTYEGAVDFGLGPLPEVASFPGMNGFIVKYAEGGRVLWARGFGAAPGTLFPDTAFEVVTVDSARNITVRGVTSDRVEVGDTPVTGFFLAQLSPSGRVLWVRQLRGNFGGSPGLTVDRHDNIIMAGSVSGPADFGGGVRVTGPESAFVVKYAQDGTWLWDRVFIAPDTAAFGGVVTDEDDNIYPAGSFFDEVDLGGGPLHGPPGVETAMVARFNPNGRHIWSRAFVGTTGLTRFDDVAVHGNRVVMGGRLTGTLEFDGRTLRARPLGGSGLLLAVTRDGEDRWGRVLGLRVQQVAADLEDDMTVLGSALPGDDVGSGPLPPTSSFYNFVLKLDRVDGKRRWVRALPADVSIASSLSVARHGEVAVAGEFRGAVDFGTGPISPTTPDFFDPYLLTLTP